MLLNSTHDWGFDWGFEGSWSMRVQGSIMYSTNCSCLQTAAATSDDWNCGEEHIIVLTYMEMTQGGRNHDCTNLPQQQQIANPHHNCQQWSQSPVPPDLSTFCACIFSEIPQNFPAKITRYYLAINSHSKEIIMKTGVLFRKWCFNVAELNTYTRWLRFRRYLLIFEKEYMSW